jgi:ATP-dependent Lon protease
MVVTIAVQSPEATSVVEAADDRLLLVPRIEGSFAKVGVIASIVDRTPAARTPRGERPATITVKAESRARMGTGTVGHHGVLEVEVEPIADEASDPDTQRLAAEYRAVAAVLLERIGGPQMAGSLRSINTPGALADSVAYWPELSTEQRIQLLETTEVTDRLHLAIEWVKEAIAELTVAEEIQKEVSGELEKGQREAILRRQMATIRSELGESEDDVVGEFRSRLEELATAEPPALDEQTAKAIAKEIDRLERTGSESMEASWIRAWLETVFELPWDNRAEERLELDEARAILDADHTGLDEVKDRLIEHLAVRKLRAERGVVDQGRRRGVILALAGPPGVGKTSLGESIARALGRSFVRLALGGVRDEAEIRGHRRTYVGSRPGRLVRALTEAGSMNPVVLLDEIDKVGSGWQGDPSAALLEVLDPAQNHSFRDHYLEFELDLSDVFFIATANVLDTIPGPLLDRMEIISIDGYTEAEKTAIAVDHLLPKLVERNGLQPEEVVIERETIEAIAADYTREAGVRRLERLLDKALRKAAMEIAQRSEGEDGPVTIGVDDLRRVLGRSIPREEVADRIDRPGIATGLAVTGAGGDVLFVETALVDGEGDPLLTGQLGDVMKESAAIVRSLVSSQAERFGVTIPSGKRVHVHFPAGSVPKDGPSAGVTMTTALVSLLSGRRVREDVAMTGEVALGGKVLPIGGVKQKVLAAHRAGIRTVLLPQANGPDVDDVPEDVRQEMTIHLVGEVSEVLDLALTPEPGTPEPGTPEPGIPDAGTPDRGEPSGVAAA